MNQSQSTEWTAQRILELHKEGIKTWQIQRILYDEGRDLSYSRINEILRHGDIPKAEKNLLKKYTDDWLEDHAIKHESIARRYRKEQKRRKAEDAGREPDRDNEEL